MQSGPKRLSLEMSEPQTIGSPATLTQGATAVLVCWEEASNTQTLSQALELACGQLHQPYHDARIIVSCKDLVRTFSNGSSYAY